MADSSPTLWQYVATAIVSLLTGGGLKYLIDRQRAPSERRVLDAQAGVGEVDELQKRVVATVSVIDIYKEGTDDAVEQIRAMKRELRQLRKENADLRQANAILRDMRGIKLPEKSEG